MELNNSLALAPASPPDAGRAPEKEVLVDLHELFVPEVLFVEDVGRVDLRGNTAREVLDAFAAISAFDGGVIAMRLGVGFFQKREPGFVGVLALCKVLYTRLSLWPSSSWLDEVTYQGPAIALIDLAVCLLRVHTVAILPQNSLKERLIVVRFREIQLHEVSNPHAPVLRREGWFTLSSIISLNHSPSR